MELNSQTETSTDSSNVIPLKENNLLFTHLKKKQKIEVCHCNILNFSRSKTKLYLTLQSSLTAYTNGLCIYSA